jgi:hypothetical protein
MRPKIAKWFKSPTQKRWRSPYRRSSRSSTGLKILLVAVSSIAGVIGLSDIFSQIVDSEWVEGTSTYSERIDHSEMAPTPRRSGIAAENPLPPRGTPATTGVGLTPTTAVTPAPATLPAAAPRALAAAPAPAQPARAAVPAPALASPQAQEKMPPSRRRRPIATE